jgi:uncharacterized protein YhfF
MSGQALATDSEEVLDFMIRASKALNIDLPASKDILKFGHTSSVVQNLNAKALAGLKTTTTTWPIPDPIPWSIGDYSIGLDENDSPLFIMATITLEGCNFEDVSENHALGEAEGDYEDWRDGHVRYYNEVGDVDEQGRKFEDGRGRLVLCENFEIVWVRDEVEWFGRK